MQERGRAHKDKLDQISNEYASLHSLFRKLVRSEEESHRSRELSRDGWFKLAGIEESPVLCRAFTEYGNATALAEAAQEESLIQLKTVVLDALKVNSLRLKQQKRSLSRRGRSEEQEKEESKPENDMEISMQSFENKHVEEMKQLLLHLINAEMHYHAQALQALSDRYHIFHSIDQEE